MQKFKFAELNGFQWKLLLIFSINLIRFLFSLWNKLRGKLAFGYSSEILNKQLKICGRLIFPRIPHLGVMFIKFRNCIWKRIFSHTNFSLDYMQNNFNIPINPHILYYNFFFPGKIHVLNLKQIFALCIIKY